MLSQAVEKHFRLAPNIYKKPVSENTPDVMLHFALKSSLKSAIYRIVSTFHGHIR